MSEPPALPPLFAAMLRQARLPLPVAEHRFDTRPADKTARPKIPRGWRWDFCWPEAKLALECQGGVWSGGKHGRGSGVVKDMDKTSEGAAQGWRVIQVTPDALCTATTIDRIRRALDA